MTSNIEKRSCFTHILFSSNTTYQTSFFSFPIRLRIAVTPTKPPFFSFNRYLTFLENLPNQLYVTFFCVQKRKIISKWPFKGLKGHFL